MKEYYSDTRIVLYECFLNIHDKGSYRTNNPMYILLHERQRNMRCKNENEKLYLCQLNKSSEEMNVILLNLLVQKLYDGSWSRCHLNHHHQPLSAFIHLVFRQVMEISYWPVAGWGMWYARVYAHTYAIFTSIWPI